MGWIPTTLRAALLGASAMAIMPPMAASAQTFQAPEKHKPEDLVVTASLSGTAISRHLLGSSITTISAQEVEDRETRIVSDVLRDVPGVSVSRAGAIGGQTQLRIRGSEGNHVLVLIDGIKVSDPYQGEFDFGTLISKTGAQIEVLRGQQSALYGSDAIGGGVNYITQSGQAAPGLKMRAEAGSFGTISGAARMAGVRGDLDYVVSGSFYGTDGYAVAPGGSRETGSMQTTLSSKLAWTPNENFKLSGVLRYNAGEADTINQGASDDAPLVRGRRIVSLVDTPGSYYQSKAWYGLMKADLESLDGLLTTSLSGQFSDIRRDAYDVDGYSYGNIGMRYGGSFINQLKFGSDSVRHNLTLAAELQRERYRNAAPTVPDKTTKTIDMVGYIAQYDLTLDDRFALGGSVRYDDNRYFNDAATWHVHTNYLLPSDTRLRAAAGTGVKAPTSFELFGYSSGQYIGNPDLQPEESRGWEIGLDQSLFGGALSLGATYFDSELTHEIYTAYLPPNYSVTSFNRTTKTKQKGVELFGHARLGALKASANWTWLDAPQDRDVLLTSEIVNSNVIGPVTAQAVRRAKNSGSLNITYAPEALPTSATLTIRLNGKMNDVAYTPSYSAFYAPLPAYTVVNFSLRYQIADPFGAFVRAENIFDKKYQEILTYNASGRAIYAGIRANFQ